MKKILFVVLSVFIISNIGYSEIQNFNGIVFDDRAFGEAEQCKGIGIFYLMGALFRAEQETRFNDTELFDNIVNMGLEINTLLKNEGWNKSDLELDNIDLYYKSKCRKIQTKDFVSIDTNDYSNYIIILRFYNYMDNLGMFKN